MTQDEAEKLARELRDTCRFHAPDQACAVRHLCDHILSGDHKREIENAAYERAAAAPNDLAQRWRCTLAANRHHWPPAHIAMFESAIEGVEATESAIRALIQPPAQKENGE